MKNKAIEMIKKEEASCIIVKNNNIICSQIGKGIKPLLDIYLNNKEALEGAFLADRVIGKAAAMLVVKSKIQEVYGYITSKEAVDLLMRNKIKVEYTNLVEYIANMNNTGMCPLEKTVSEYSNIDEAIEALSTFVYKS